MQWKEPCRIMNGHQNSSSKSGKGVTDLTTAQLHLPCSGLSFSNLSMQSGYPILAQVPDVYYRMSWAGYSKLTFSVGNLEWAVYTSAFTWWTPTQGKSTVFPPAWASPDYALLKSQVSDTPLPVGRGREAHLSWTSPDSCCILHVLSATIFFWFICRDWDLWNSRNLQRERKYSPNCSAHQLPHHNYGS